MFAVTKLSNFVIDPNIKHYIALVWLLQYIKGNKCHALKYYNNSTDLNVNDVYANEVLEIEIKC